MHFESFCPFMCLSYSYREVFFYFVIACAGVTTAFVLFFVGSVVIVIITVSCVGPYASAVRLYTQHTHKLPSSKNSGCLQLTHLEKGGKCRDVHVTVFELYTFIIAIC